jgi:hypothetical protein
MVVAALGIAISARFVVIAARFALRSLDMVGGGSKWDDEEYQRRYWGDDEGGA